MIPVNQPFLKGNEKKYLIECIETGWISSEGPFIQRFEEAFAVYHRKKHAVAVANGTAALDIAVEALGIGLGDEVILPAFTIISCVNQIVRSGAKPVLVDSDPYTWNMDVNQVEAKINDKTRAIMAVHIYGLPVDMTPLIALAKKHKLKIIEDASQALGQTYDQKLCGTFGDISTFSFYPNKHITTGEGGMVVTDDDGLAEQARSLRNLCFQPHKRFVHECLGWNYRMTNMQAAIGLAQLEQLNAFIVRKREIGLRYQELCSNLPGIQLPCPGTRYAENIYWVFGVLLNKTFDIDSEEVMQRLSGLGIGTRPFFFPMHQQPILNRLGFFKNECHPVSENLYKYGFYLPSGLALADEQIEQVIGAVKMVLS